ncbi:SusD/RagB family nutrient-binding outer membrane lipoprotein [Alistipes sp. An116]|uniref:RagB/SusD family nutrient uptake outer membrane protein n=1 Tax=Alistipes sp. An116 TaxID=1965546 RepID=UPI000B370443|nr:RagB/SusD family nutrient uptake outer membrane protein [Alistipes sp. An116]OUQ51316.1 SusD/RagB family nutrient-binding outer membrane lipoprotein [Alistipes sp. An116]
MKNIWKPLLLSVLLAGSACTANYLEFNSNPFQPNKDQMQADGYMLGATLTGMMSAVISTDVNTAQFTDCLLGGTQGGYFADSNPELRNTISNYNATDDWTRVFMASDRVIPTLYSNLRELKLQTDDPVVLAIADVIKVTAMHRVTDTYGPIPYSQIGVDGQVQVPYDSQEAVYDKFFEELDAAIAVLTAHRTSMIAASADNIYGGSVEKWCRFANSLKLRLAMHIVYANPTKAREMAESAVAHEVGVMSSNDDNACMTVFGADGNPLFVAVNYNKPTHVDHTACQTGGDSHAAADIICYMNAYNDPRRAAYFVESEWPGQTYVGMRRGIEIPDLTSIGHKYSGVKLTSSSPLCWMNAAEVAFLKAEAAGVFGFNMGPGSAESFYKEGIRLSFEQWGVSGYEEYVAQGSVSQILYVDPNSGKDTYSTTLSTMPVAWQGGSAAQMQEQIIIQKWIANWLLGNESWVDYRRTGYPHLIPATEAGNKSNGIVDSKLGARRMPYPADERTANADNYQQAINELLKGADNMATRMWWDCNPAIN